MLHIISFIYCMAAVNTLIAFWCTGHIQQIELR
jgi:hypothetical protein